MRILAPIETRTDLQLTDDDKLRIGIAWDALSPNSRRAYQQAWRSVSEWLQSQSFTLDDLTGCAISRLPFCVRYARGCPCYAQYVFSSSEMVFCECASC